LLTIDQYFISDGLLYKLGLPHKVKLQRTYPVSQRLCLAPKYRAELLKHCHDRLGHYAVDRLFLTLYSAVFWPNMYLDVKAYCQTCEVCLRTKRNYNFKTKLLNPLSPPTAPFEQLQLDHKDLLRMTKQGSVAIFCMIDSFSGWPICRAVPDLSAETHTAKTFF